MKKCKFKAAAILFFSVAAVTAAAAAMPTAAASAVSDTPTNIIGLTAEATTLDEANTKVESDSITVALNEQENVDGYQVTLSENEDFASPRVVESAEPTFTFEELKPNTKYYFSAITFVKNENDGISYSQELRFGLMTIKQAKPSAPVFLSLKSSYFSISANVKSNSGTDG